MPDDKFRLVMHYRKYTVLNFPVRRPLESEPAFHQRLNKQTRDEEYQSGVTQDSGEWMLGENLCKNGSIHSGTWHGTAAELAARLHIAVFPVAGWWKQRSNLERWGKQARYALIVTIRTPEIETDIYTSVANQVGISIEV